MKSLRAKLSYANVMATCAVVVALAGGGTAIALSAAKNSVTSRSIRSGNVTASDLAGVRVVRSQGTVTTAGGSASASCQSGERVIGGGAQLLQGDGTLTASSIDGNGWSAQGRAAIGTAGLAVHALCLKKRASSPRTG